MREFLEALGAHGPRFLSDFTNFVAGPKHFLRELELGASDALPRALTFYVLSVAVTFLLELPFLESTNELWKVFAVTVVLFTIGSVLIAAMFRTAFAIVRGKGSLRDHLIVTLYFSGPYYVLCALTAATAKGIVRSNASHLFPLFKEFMDASLSPGWSLETERFAALFVSGPALIAIALSYLLYFVLSPAYFIACWGALRHINGIGRLRSTLAFIATLVLSVPLYYFLASAQRGLGVNLF